MKSENAKEYITHATCTAQEYAERFGGRELVVSRWDVSTAIELAEQDAEERMRDKAIEAFCKDCPIYSIQTSNGGNCPDCSALNAFKQRLNEE
jgi:hypothetical protein